MIADVTRSLGTDYYLLEEMLSDEERGIRDKVRAFADREVIPIINDYWEKAEFPFEIIPKLAELNVAGFTIEGYGCPGMSRRAAGLVALELSRGDGSINTFLGVHSGLTMGAIAMLGSEEQKERWLPPMARLEKVGAFALTEPNHGSDSVALEASAQREGGEWVINGEKRWIGNATFADLVIVWARDVEDGRVKGFVVEKNEGGSYPEGTRLSSSPARSASAPYGSRTSRSQTSGCRLRISSKVPTLSRTSARSLLPPAAARRGSASDTPSPVTRRRSSTPKKGCSSANP